MTALTKVLVALAASIACAVLGLLSHTNGEMNAWLVAALAWFSYSSALRGQ